MTGRIKSKGLRWEVTEENLEDTPNAPGVYALYYYGKRRYVGKSKNLRRRLKHHYNNDVAFTEFTWYETSLKDVDKLESDSIDQDFDELWNEIRRKRRKH